MQKMYNPELLQNSRNLRKNMTKEERRLWYSFLRDYPIRFQRQKIIGYYIVDFYCARAKLVVELDGSQHYDEEEMRQDRMRTAYLEQFGLKVVRIPNNEVNQNLDGVCEYIDRLVRGDAGGDVG